MSLDYTTLQSTVLDQAVRPELTTEVVQFIRSCESLIKRKVQALEYRSTLVEADRVGTSGVYNLSGNVLEIRALFGLNLLGESFPLRNVGMANIRALSAASPSLFYALSGQTVEIRGTPGTDAEFEHIYWGWPDPLATTSTNTLLDLFEDLYVSGSLFYLYTHTQDVELAQGQLDIFMDCARSINKIAARRVGGAEQMPSYNFGQIRTGARFSGASCMSDAINCMALAAWARLPDRAAAKPIAKRSAATASRGRSFASTGALASTHLRVSIRKAARASARWLRVRTDPLSLAAPSIWESVSRAASMRPCWA